MHGEEAETLALNNLVLTITVIPSFTELTRSSPSKGKTSKRIDIDSEVYDKHCRVCNIKFEFAASVSSDSPWMGCIGKTGRKECNYWVTQCANVLGMLQRRYKGQLLQSRTLQTKQTLTGTKHETTS